MISIIMVYVPYRIKYSIVYQGTLWTVICILLKYMICCWTFLPSLPSSSNWLNSVFLSFVVLARNYSLKLLENASWARNNQAMNCSIGLTSKWCHFTHFICNVQFEGEYQPTWKHCLAFTINLYAEQYWKQIEYSKIMITHNFVF